MDFLNSDGLVIQIPSPSTQMINFLISATWLLLGFYAIYLAFRCNRGNFSIGHLLAALFFAPLYVIYHIANGFAGC
jgi:hypothetical protein